uniref:Peptidase n=1 Tax=Marseillevirus sp. TaxID=2809551 RepID=A0AA96J2X4_9VIRU|nr:peptidase [Marseillevirus sp.]
MNSSIKREFSVSRDLYVPVYRSAASVPQPSTGSIAYDNSTQATILSNGISWYSPASSSAPGSLGAVYGTTSATDPSATGLGYQCGTAAGENVFVGTGAGQNMTGTQTGLTFVGVDAGNLSQSVNNKTIVGRSAGVSSTQQNGTGVGRSVLGVGTGSGCVAIGDFSQNANTGSRSCSIGTNTLGIALGPVYNDCVAIGYERLQSTQTGTGLINIGSSMTPWDSGTSTNVIYIGGGSTLSSNITNVIALGSGTFAGAAVANNTFAVADDITQWRSLGLTVSASANVLQFDPVTGLITQAASSRRFKQDIEDADERVPSLANAKVCTYKIDGSTEHGVIAEDIPEFYACSDKEGINGVMMTRIIMALLCEVQKLKKEITEEKVSKKK